MAYELESEERGPDPNNSREVKAYFRIKLQTRVLAAGIYEANGNMALFEDDDDVVAIVWERDDDGDVQLFRAAFNHYRMRWEEYDWAGNPDDFIEEIDISPTIAKFLIPFLSEQISPLEQLALSSGELEDLVNEHAIMSNLK